MTDLEPPADDPPVDAEPAPAPPVNCEQLEQEAAERPKSLRLLPKITADAVRLVWAANPPMLVASIGLKLVTGAGRATALIFGENRPTSTRRPRRPGRRGDGAAASAAAVKAALQWFADHPRADEPNHPTAA